MTAITTNPIHANLDTLHSAAAQSAYDVAYNCFLPRSHFISMYSTFIRVTTLSDAFYRCLSLSCDRIALTQLLHKRRSWSQDTSNSLQVQKR